MLKYSLRMRSIILLNRDNLTEAIQISLPQKQKTFSEFFLAFLKSVLNFKHLPEKDDRDR